MSDATTIEQRGTPSNELKTVQLLVFALAAGIVVAGCSSGTTNNAVMPALQKTARTMSLSGSSIPAPASINVVATILSPTSRTIQMTMTLGTNPVISANCVRLSASVVGTVGGLTFHNDRLCTATSGATGTISLRMDGTSSSTGNPFALSGTGIIYGGTGDFINLYGQFNVAGEYNFGSFPEIDTETWTGQYHLAPS